MMRITHITYGLWLFLILLLMVAGLSLYSFDPLLAGILIVFYGGVYTGKLMMAQLVDGVERSPGLFAPIMLLLHFFTGYFNSIYVFFILFLYLLVNILLLVIRTFRALKDDWYWINPPVSDTIEE